MKYLSPLSLLSVCLLISCTEGTIDQANLPEAKQPEVLPFQTLNLNDLNGFRLTTSNWQIVGNALSDETTNGTFITETGTGILLNAPAEGSKDHLFSTFEHGDIEIELDVMMPHQSNSGLYFQGRYEVQLFDSWGVTAPQHSDMGGIYQRWDDSRANKGYEGSAPSVNAAKAPGLWQHFKIKFQAAKFDDAGNKTKNAMFEEVWLNGSLLHENQEVTGPTRSSAFEDEQPLGPLMIQGDHGVVAFRNLQYKLYEDKQVSLQEVRLKEYVEYKNTNRKIPNADTLEIEREISNASLSAAMATGENPQKLLVFNGNMVIPNSGDYLFDMRIDGGGGVLLINGDTIANLDGDYNLSNPSIELTNLQQGTVPFTFFYNKHRPFRSGFALSVEGPGIAKHSLHALGSVDMNRLQSNSQVVAIEVTDETVLQRGFLMHRGVKKTHSIAVGTPQSIHYAFDLADGSLLQTWGGDFLNAAGMWVGRGSEQLATPMGNAITISGGPDFAHLRNDRANWPDSIPANDTYRQLGYELDNGNPTFSMELNGSVVTTRFIPSDNSRSLKRIISTSDQGTLWHKLGEGSSIEKLPSGKYAIDDKSYFVDFSGNDGFEPIIRKSNGKAELIVKIPAGNQQLTYAIIW